MSSLYNGISINKCNENEHMCIHARGDEIICRWIIMQAKRFTKNQTINVV